MKTKFSGILALLLVLVVQLSFAQQKTITGTVNDDSGLPLPGANVIIKGTNTGTQTDFDGNYSVSAATGQTLIFSYIGFETQEMAVGASSRINVNMASDNALQEVVIIGNVNSTKEKSSTATYSISAETIQSRPNASFVQTLSGQVPGLNISTANGQPGANSNVRIRGISSINGDTEPLFIIDGAPVDQDNFRSLNPNEIASVSVLKDAGATAIYGNRGANGVIIIKTKSGKFNSKLKMSYTGTVNVAALQDNDYDLMNSQELLTLERERNVGVGGNGFPVGNTSGMALTDAEIAGVETFDWADYFFDPAITNSHTLNVSNGGENLASYVSLGFHDQEGLLRQSSLKRFNIRTNVNGTSDNKKFSYKLNLSTNWSKSDEPNRIGSGAINRNYVLGAYQSVPYITASDYTNGADLLSPLSFANTPLFLVDRLNTYTRYEEELKMIGALEGSYNLTDDLVASVIFSSDYQDQNTLRAEQPISFNSQLFAESGNDTPGTQDQQYRRQFSFNQLASLVWNKTFDKQSLNIGLYSEYFKAHLYTYGFRNNGLNQATFFPGDGSAFVDDNGDNDFFGNTVNANIAESGLFSYFTRVDYDYDTRYGITGTFRRDASSRFSDSNRWANFYSVSARWNISNEAFMSNSVFDVLKLRASYGTNGNQDVTGGGLFGGLNLTQSLFATTGGYQGANSLQLSQIPNTDLKWETVTTTNVGIDYEFANRRARGSLDVYQKVTTDLFLLQPISAINATTALNVNGGELKNTGVDLAIAYDVIRSTSEGGFNATINFVGNYNKNEIVEFGSGEEEIIGTGRVGGKVFEYYDYRYAGVNSENGNLQFLTADGEITETPDPDTDRVWLDKN
ncbi:MAG: TonB-linked SusC/RagA family outer membrane protein, partial [Patiriisocius sp.]